MSENILKRTNSSCYSRAKRKVEDLKGNTRLGDKDIGQN